MPSPSQCIVITYRHKGKVKLAGVEWVVKGVSLDSDKLCEVLEQVADQLNVPLARIKWVVTDNASYANLGSEKFAAKCDPNGRTKVVRCMSHGIQLALEAFCLAVPGFLEINTHASVCVGGPAGPARRDVFAGFMPRKAVNMLRVAITRWGSRVRANHVLAEYPSEHSKGLDKLVADKEDGKQLAAAKARFAAPDVPVVVALVDLALNAMLPVLKASQGQATLYAKHVTTYQNSKERLARLRKDPRAEACKVLGDDFKAKLRRLEASDGGRALAGKIFLGVATGPGNALAQYKEKVDDTMDIAIAQILTHPYRAIDMDFAMLRPVSLLGKSAACAEAWLAWVDHLTTLKLTVTTLLIEYKKKSKAYRKKNPFTKEPGFPPELLLSAEEYWETFAGDGVGEIATIVPLLPRVLELHAAQISGAEEEATFSKMAFMFNKYRKGKLSRRRARAELILHEHPDAVRAAISDWRPKKRTYKRKPKAPSGGDGGGGGDGDSTDDVGSSSDDGGGSSEEEVVLMTSGDA